MRRYVTVEEHLSVDALAARLGVHPSTVWAAIAQGRQSRDRSGRRGIFPVTRIGAKATRIPASVANSWIAALTDRP